MKEKTNIEKLDEQDETNPNRVSRGGSWRYDAGFTRVSGRDWYNASHRGNRLGFRLVLQTKEKK